MSAAISNQLRVPGAFDVQNLCDGKMNLVGVQCTENSPILGTSLRHLTSLFPDLSLTVLAIIRDGKVILPRSGVESMETGDRVYFVCDSTHLDRAMASFGHEEGEARSVVIAGGGSIGLMLSREIEANFHNTNNQIIELHAGRAKSLAEELQGTGIINGDALDSAILREAGVHKTETFVAVTEDDEVNKLASPLTTARLSAHCACGQRLRAWRPAQAFSSPRRVSFTALMLLR